MFSHRAKSPENHRPKEENRLSWVLVALTSSQISGTRLYTRTMPVTAVSSGLRRGRSTEGRLLRSMGRRLDRAGDRKSTRLNSSHVSISYAVFCLNKKIPL